MKYKRFFQATLFVIVLAAAARMPAPGSPPQVPPAVPESPAFGDFKLRVEQYIKLRKSLPQQHNTTSRKKIVDRRSALAQAIREARAGAKPGDIFSPEISEQFLKVIRRTLKGPTASSVRKTIQGDPVTGLHLSVNGAYPEDLPLTTVPPTLLRGLPQLPERLAYRIVGHDFVLQDTQARLVIDLIPGAFP